MQALVILKLDGSYYVCPITKRPEHRLFDGMGPFKCPICGMYQVFGSYFFYHLVHVHNKFCWEAGPIVRECFEKQVKGLSCAFPRVKPSFVPYPVMGRYRKAGQAIRDAMAAAAPRRVLQYVEPDLFDTKQSLFSN